MKRRVLSLALVLMLLLSLMPTAVLADGATSGCYTDDYDVTYTLEKGVLTATSSGGDTCSTAWEYEFDPLAVTDIVIGDGITNINDESFAKCKNLKTVTMSDDVEAVGAHAFKDCTELKSVQLGTGLVDIAFEAFMGCTALESLVIPDSVIYIGDSAFADCSSLKSITLGGGVESLGTSVFRNTAYYDDAASWEDGLLYIGDCLVAARDDLSGAVSVKDGTRLIGSETLYGRVGITSLKLPDSVKLINYNAFAYCEALTDISIPATLEDIGMTAFYCTGYYYNDANWENNLLYLGNCLLSTTSGIDTACDIKEGTRLIAAYAAWAESGIPSVTLPESLEIIGDYAFCGCSALTELRIPSSVRSIGVCAFSECSGLTDLVIEEGLTEIGGFAFNFCTSLTNVTLPASLTSVASFAFSGCENITDVYYGGSEEQWCAIEFGFENDCLTTANIHCGSGSVTPHVHSYTDVVTAPTCTDRGYTTHTCSCGEAYVDTYIDALGHDYKDGACTRCGEKDPNASSGETSGSYTDDNGITYTLENGVLTVSGNDTCGDAWQSYFDASAVTKLVIENGVTAVGAYAFYGCAALESLSIPESVTELGESAFGECTALTDVTIPNGVTTLDYGVFFGCTALRSVTIPDSVTKLGGGVFNGCASLDSITIPGSVMSIGPGAFFGTAYYNNDANWENDVLYIDGCLIVSLSTNSGDYRVKEGTRLIADSAFSVNENLTGVTIPDGVKVIGDYAFNSCSALTGVTIPNSVTTLGGYVFNVCTALESITLPDGLTSISRGLFNVCSALESVTIPAGVTSIAENAFFGCDALSDVYFGGTEEQWSAISVDSNGNDRLAEVTVHYAEAPHVHEYTDTVTAPTCTDKGYTIRRCACGDVVEEYVDALGHDYVNGVCSRCGMGHEWTDDNGISYKLNNGILTVSGKGVVSTAWSEHIDRQEVTKAVIENGITGIGFWGFSNCSALRSVSIPSSVTSINNYAFGDCIALKSITIPDSVTDMGAHTFSGCYSLESVTIGKGVTSIGGGVFYDCTALKSVTIPASVTSVEQFAFDSCNALTDVHYAGTEAQWKAISIETGNDYLTTAAIHYGSTPAPAVTFTDVVDTAYYAEPISWAVEKGITGGYNDGTFKPMAICTRAQIVTFIWRAHGCPEPEGTAKGFNDVLEGTYYYKAVLWAAEKGITGGFDDGGFHPDELVTRAQAMTFLWRAEGKPAVPAGTVNTFADVPEGAYYHDAVLWAVANGVTGGYDSTTFGSMDGCTRAQIVTFLYRDMAK